MPNNKITAERVRHYLEALCQAMFDGPLEIEDYETFLNDVYMYTHMISPTCPHGDWQEKFLEDEQTLIEAGFMNASFLTDEWKNIDPHLSPESLAKMQEEINRVAYFNWINAGRPEGRDQEFWDEAVEEVCGPQYLTEEDDKYLQTL